MTEWTKVIRHPNYLINKNGLVFDIRKNKIKKIPTVGKIGYQIMRIENEVKPLHYWILNSWKKNPDPKNLTDVNHINSIRWDNRLENLEFISHKDNCNTEHCKLFHFLHKHGLLDKKVRGTKVSDSNIVLEFKSLHEAGRKLGINYQCISACCRKKIKTSGGFKWEFI